MSQMFLNSFFWNPQVSEPCLMFRFVKKEREPVRKEKGTTWKVFIIIKPYIRMDTAIMCGVNSVFLLCSFGTLPQYIFFPLLFTIKSTFKGPIFFFSTKCSVFLLKQLLSKEHSKELLEAACCLSTLIWNNIMTTDRWSEHGLSFHHGTSEIFFNKFNTSKLMLDTGKMGKREDFIEFDKSQCAMTGLVSHSTSQTVAPVGCSYVCSVQHLSKVVHGQSRWTDPWGRAGWPDHLIQQAIVAHLFLKMVRLLLREKKH